MGFFGVRDSSGSSPQNDAPNPQNDGGRRFFGTRCLRMTDGVRYFGLRPQYDVEGWGRRLFFFMECCEAESKKKNYIKYSIKNKKG